MTAPSSPEGEAALLELATRTAVAAGRLVVEHRESALSDVDTKSTPTDVVTAADRASERLITDHLLAARPEDAVLGEEQGARAGSSGLQWVVDPIDGTVNYLYGIPAYAVSIAARLESDAADDGAVVAGVVHNPATGETWTALRGQGSWLDGRPLHCNRPPSLAQAMVATGFGYDAGRRAEQARVVAALLPEIRDIRRIGAASLDLCAVATGRVDAYFERGLQPWDGAAGGLVVREAGGLVGGLGGVPEGEAMTLAAPTEIYTALHDRLVELHADRGV